MKDEGEAEEILIVFCTFPDSDTARKIAGKIVEEGLAACVNLLPGVTSIYIWDGKQQSSEETLSLIKTTRARYPALEARLAALHPYEVPEILALGAAAALPQYAEWVRSEKPK
jgi:periplasmic divalent cation tolerance protein